MSADMTRSLLESVYAAEKILRLSSSQIEGIAHAPTRTFLTEVGLPDSDACPFWWAEELDGGLRRLGDFLDAEEDENGEDGLPPEARGWFRLGGIGYDDVVLDGCSGRVYCLPEEAFEPYTLNRDVDSFARFLYIVGVKWMNAHPGGGVPYRQPPEDIPDALARMREVDPVGLEDPDSLWHRWARKPGWAY
ncbi:SUKH-4 family immunity protein [Streptomyces sp. NPDC003077]|uniref:SUKH-4 family immunity protein n=1 Tax=Streptomyces sp. NPDC003077 TaxID=3154443 RepID=UPI0033B07738